MTRALFHVAPILMLLALPAFAGVIEEKRWVDASAVDRRGVEVSRPIMVTIFYDDTAPKPYPLLILNHGRAPEKGQRTTMGRASYSSASHWFARLGFMVAVPTRIGYGVTGGDDVEHTGPCTKKNYPPGYAASAAQTLAVLQYLRERREASKDRAVIVGQSFGGTTAITIAAMQVPGIQAAINFAGGGGGNPKTHPGKPCAQPQLERLFADYGKTARVPTLWIYSENDQYMGAKLPKVWFDAFRAQGGIGEFRLFPPHGADGHGIFTRAPEWWQPAVLEFLRTNGYPGLRAPAT